MTDLFFRQFTPSSTDSTPEGGDPLAIYVHWPWCLKKCPYCDFNSHVDDARPADAYVKALMHELTQWRPLVGTRPVVSLFVGGGTPSLMGAARIGQIVDCVNRLFSCAPTLEVTVECNPTSSPATLFGDLALAGVNRVSVGVQGLDDGLLKFLGREHSVDAAVRTLDAAQNAFENVNADLIYGLPKQDLRQWQNDLRAMAERGLAHISAYQLTIEPNTGFFADVRKGKWTPLDNDFQADFMAATDEILEGAGYQRYEISNYARTGRACVHNRHVWEYGDYLGVGAGAHGRICVGDTRYATSVRKDPLAYLQLINSHGEAFVQRLPVAPNEALQEAFMMGLRLADGVDVDILGKVIHNADWETSLDMARIRTFTQLGLLERIGNRLRASAQGRAHLDHLLREILR